MLMEYLRNVWQLEDRTRVVAIFAIAVVVLGLGLFDTTHHHGGADDHGAHSHMEHTH